MKSNFRKAFFRLFSWLIILFVILFVFRLLYGYTKKLDTISGHVSFFDELIDIRRNIASNKYIIKGGASAQKRPLIGMDQKYEKVAKIASKSAQFDAEEEQVREEIEKKNALIQFEQKSGNAGKRRLHLIIGVPPENFDSLYQQLILIGQVQSKEITKKDKTNEYKELQAKKATLEKTRSSLIELKNRGGKIGEYIDLENRILDIEEELQTLGVNLGEFDEENEFCTIRFSMNEGKIVQISFMHRVKVALEWTISMYLQLVVSLFFVALFAYFAILIVQRLRMFVYR